MSESKKRNPQANDVVKEMTDSWQSPAKMAEPVKVLGVTFETKEYPGFSVEHTIISKNEKLSEIVFHMKFKTLKRMGEVSEFLAKELPNAGMETRILASQNPEFISNWDLILERVEKGNAAYYRDRILQLLDILTRSQ